MHAIYFECPRDFTLLSFSGFGDSANGSVSMIFVHINYSQVSRLSHVPGGGGGAATRMKSTLLWNFFLKCTPHSPDWL